MFLLSKKWNNCCVIWNSTNSVSREVNSTSEECCNEYSSSPNESDDCFITVCVGVDYLLGRILGNSLLGDKGVLLTNGEEIRLLVVPKSQADVADL